ncbi:MAG TPA: preprotein translocase subunit SecE [bacterium]|jgi:preprotein translocase SecE subunit|nr:preprotein translocase subunit SecE [Patescibacteria group bacterium]HNU76339.1 preprotein translocase subunit SecE [bacterium]HPD74246.1 preprotein translocase subunit SecE [bacterium]HRY56688.1 preprotein translocase subunit SecE [Patescibacteria group bacterium]
MCGVNRVSKFVKESFEELKKVQFPNKKETLRLTGYVIGISLVTGVLVTLLDYLFKEFLTFIITK